LSEWIKEANRDSDKNPIKEKDLNRIGSKAVPFLIYSIKKNIPGETQCFGELFPTAIRKYLPKKLYQRKPYGSFDQCLYALEKLSDLGANAKPAIPLLLKIVDHPQESLRFAAAMGLNSIGPESWDDVVKILSRTGSKARRSILLTLTHRLSTPAPTPSTVERKRILEILLNACVDSDPEIQQLGVGGLMNCRAFHSYQFTDLDLPHRAGPVIANCLNYGDGMLKVVSARALYYYPESVDLAIDNLEQMAADKDDFYRSPAHATLQVYQNAPDLAK